MIEQLTFDLPVRPALGREDFLVSPANALAVATLDQPDLWPNGKLLLIGPEGAGKTHLAMVFAARTGAQVIEAGDLAAADLPEAAALVIENADTAAGDPDAETALFHLHNHMTGRGGLLLLTAARAPRDWGLTLPDLQSRMEATATATLLPPDDALLGAVLVKLFADRQLQVAPASSAGWCGASTVPSPPPAPSWPPLTPPRWPRNARSTAPLPPRFSTATARSRHDGPYTPRRV